MGKKISNFLKGEIVSSVFYILFGLCLVFLTEQTVNIICKVVFGLVMVGAGIYHIYIYAGEKENATILDLFTGVIVLVLGGFLFFTPQIIVRILPYLLGAFVLVDSIWTLKGARKLKKLGNTWWKALFIGSLVFIVLGVMVVVYPFTKITYTVIFAGCVMLADGLSDIVFLILLRTGIRKGVIVKDEKTVEKAAEPVAEAPSEVQAEESSEAQAEIKTEACEEEETVGSEENPEEASEVDEGEAEEALKDEIIINGRWKRADEEAVSPAREIGEMKKAKELTEEQEEFQEELQEEPQQSGEAVQEEEILEEWKD